MRKNSISVNRMQRGVSIVHCIVRVVCVGPRHVGLLKKSIIESSNEVIFDTFSDSPSDILNTSLAGGVIAFCCRFAAE